ncbi:hypothetical protein HZS_1974 [Henneguya salminicola]|nr:hypothetical protein HZS_1974 [Henneguya salminicola]
MDDQETYFKYIHESATVESEEEEEYDSDGNVINTYKKREIIPLTPIDHSSIKYSNFQKNFHLSHQDLDKLKPEEIEKLRKNLDIKVSGLGAIPPCVSFAYFGFDDSLLETIRKHSYYTPTPIQAQGIPVVLSGRDLIGIAQTGSGKTAAYLLPMMIHVIDQPEIQKGDGPIALVCAPTRELCQQIYEEALKFAKSYNLKVAAVFGGANKHEQELILTAGVEIVIATPGRLIDLIKCDATNLKRVTFLVFDEADRMFELGFEPQVKSISNNVRPDRQCLLFSATFKKKVEKLSQTALTDPIRIVIGELGKANEDVHQSVIVLSNPHDKLNWLKKNIVEYSSNGNVLIFVNKKENCVEVGKYLKNIGHEVGVIHGDFTQFERDSVMNNFRKRIIKILVATDVAARGLDISSIKTVINYDISKNITTHIHRIGRTGRAGELGDAFTLVTHQDIHILPDLVRNLEASNQFVSDDLLQLALKNERFQKQRSNIKNISKQSSGIRNRFGLGFNFNQTNTSSSSASVDHKTTEHILSSNIKQQNSPFKHLKSTLTQNYEKFKKSSNQLNITQINKRKLEKYDATNKRNTRWDCK